MGAPFVFPCQPSYPSPGPTLDHREIAATATDGSDHLAAHVEATSLGRGPGRTKALVVAVHTAIEFHSSGSEIVA